MDRETVEKAAKINQEITLLNDMLQTSSGVTQISKGAQRYTVPGALDGPIIKLLKNRLTKLEKELAAL